jgi:3-oxoacyl-[acyl-carrier protein] reductase
VNCIAFGLIDTRLTQRIEARRATIAVDGHELPVGLSSEVLDVVRAGIPLGRSGAPDDAAGGVYLLCIPESDNISGQVLLVVGGLSI